MDAGLLASQGIRHVVRDGFHSVHAVLSSVSHAEGIMPECPRRVTRLALHPLPYALPRLSTAPHSRQKAVRSFLGGVVSRKNPQEMYISLRQKGALKLHTLQGSLVGAIFLCTSDDREAARLG